MSENSKEEHKSLQISEDKLLQLLQENDDDVGALANTQGEIPLSLEQIASSCKENFWNIVKNYGPQIVNILTEKNKGETVYCVTKKTMEKIAKMGAHFIENSAKDGLAPVYRDANGRAVGHVDLEERFLSTGNPATALAMASLSAQLAEIQKTLQDMQESINDVYKGQWNDRFAKIDAAKNELFLAQYIENSNKKTQVLFNALHLICSGESEINRSLEDEIVKCEKLGFSDGLGKAKDCMKSLIEHIPFLFEAWQIKLLILQQSDELPALAAESSRIRNEIQELFTDERLELLRSQTHSKIPFMKKFMDKNDFWTKDFKLKVDSSINRLLSIEAQSKEIISYKKGLLLEAE